MSRFPYRAIVFGALRTYMLQYTRRQNPSNFSIVVGVFFQQMTDETNMAAFKPFNIVWNTASWEQKTLRWTFL